MSKQKPHDLSAVVIAADGMLMATGIVASLCDQCTAVHIELLDKNGNAFATAVLPHENYVMLATQLWGFAQSSGIEIKRQS